MNGTESAGKDFINLCDGTVAERTNAAALKAAGRKARGFESLPFREGIRRASRMSNTVALTSSPIVGRVVSASLNTSSGAVP